MRLGRESELEIRDGTVVADRKRERVRRQDNVRERRK